MAFYFNKNMAPAVLAYSLSVLYSLTILDWHSAVVNHIIYGLIFLPCCFLATIRLAAGLLSYAAFNLFVAVDWFLYPDASMQTVIGYSYDYIQITLALSLIYIGSGVRYDNRIIPDYIARLFNLCNLQAHSKKGEGR